MTYSARRPCPVCDSSDIGTLGPIMHPQPTLVAGVELDLGNTVYWLRECRQCGFQFKDPPIDAEKLMSCYMQANSDNWDLDPDPRQRKFDVIKSVLIRHAAGRRILDVGCFNGALLHYLGEEWQKFGVEPSRQAADLARARDVNVLAATLDELDPNTAPFDAVIAIDVAEHIVEPLPFFRQLSKLLAPGGVLLILTGDNEAFAWRLQTNAYWYCSLPEHVSFYNKRSLDRIGERLGITGVEYRRLTHKRMPLRRWCSDTAKCAAYVIGRKAQGFGISRLRRLFVERRGPSIETAKDHLIYLYRKPTRS